MAIAKYMCRIIDWCFILFKIKAWKVEIMKPFVCALFMCKEICVLCVQSFFNLLFVCEKTYNHL